MIWKRRLAIGGAALVALCAIGVGVYFLVNALTRSEAGSRRRPRPDRRAHEEAQPKAAQDLGFPEFATKNTTRVAGGDPVAIAAGVALADFPSTGGVKGPDAVSLVDSSDWASGIAAASLMAHPVSAPILLSTGNEHPGPDRGRADGARPRGLGGDPGTPGLSRSATPRRPSGVDVQHVSGKDPAEVAAQIDELRQKLTGAKPDERPARQLRPSPSTRCPPPSWAARSGDPVLFVNKRLGAEAHDRGAQARQGRARLRAGAALGDLRQGARRTPAARRRTWCGSATRTRLRTRSTSRATRTAASAGTSPTPGTAW